MRIQVTMEIAIDEAKIKGTVHETIVQITDKIHDGPKYMDGVKILHMEWTGEPVP